MVFMHAFAKCCNAIPRHCCSQAIVWWMASFVWLLFCIVHVFCRGFSFFSLVVFGVNIECCVQVARVGSNKLLEIAMRKQFNWYMFWCGCCLETVVWEHLLHVQLRNRIAFKNFTCSTHSFFVLFCWNVSLALCHEDKPVSVACCRL